MTKLETLKALPTPNDLRQSVSQVQKVLDETTQRLNLVVSQVQELNELQKLPELITEQVTTALAPLATLRQDVQHILTAFDQVTTAQRLTLDTLAQDISRKSVKAMATKVQALEPPIQALTDSANKIIDGIRVSMNLLKTETGKISALPGQLKTDLSAAKDDLIEKTGKLVKASNSLKAQTDRAQAQPWKAWGLLVIASMLGALLAAAGQAGLSWLLPPSELQTNAAWMQTVWAKATPDEKELLNRIALRPAP